MQHGVENVRSGEQVPGAALVAGQTRPRLQEQFPGQHPGSLGQTLWL